MDPYQHIRHHHYPPTRPELHQKCNRGSHSSDTSSAYSGSDTMASVYGSSLEAEEVDISGLVESVVDSDEEDLAESMDSLNVRDAVRDCLEKDPSERTEDDVEILLEFTQGLKAFTNITLAVRRALCSVMVFAVVDKAGTVVMSDGEELDSWSVLINGAVEIEHANGEREELQMGDSFGILPTMDKLYHRGVMRTKCDDCQFVCITQTDYYRIQHQGEENTRRHENEEGRVVMVTELRQIGNNDATSPNVSSSIKNAHNINTKRGHVVIRGSPERLLLQLVEENSMTDPTYVEDFLLTHRIFIKNSKEVTKKLLDWFETEEAPKGSTATAQEIRDRVTRVILLWVNNHFTDFEADYEMMEFLETFEAGLEAKKLLSQLRLLHIACAAKARLRTCTLTRSSRDESLNFKIIGGYELRSITAASGLSSSGIFISHVETPSKALDVGLKRGDQIHEVNGQSFEHVTSKRAMEILMGSTHVSITVKSNLLGFKEIMQAIEQGSTLNCSANGSTSSSSPSDSLNANAAKTFRSPRRICANDIAKLHGRVDSTTDDMVNAITRTHMMRLSSVDMLLQPTPTTDVTDCAPPNAPVVVTSSHTGSMASNFMSNILHSVNSSAKKDGNMGDNKGGGFMTLAPKRRLQKALAKINLLNKNVSGLQQSSLNDSSDTLLNDVSSKPKVTGSSISSSSGASLNSAAGISIGRLYQSQSNPDLASSICFEDTNSVNTNYLTATVHRPSAASSASSNMLPDYPEHVLKVYKADQTCKYLLINKETTAHEVVMLALQEFGIHDPSSNFSLCEVSVGEGGMVKQRRLPDQLQNLAERISFAARYYLKTNGISETLVPDELALELMRDSNVHFLQLNAYELAIQLTLQDFAIFRQIESTEYVDDLFELKSKYGVPMLSKFSELVNREMFWVVTEICGEHNIVRRMKIVKQFIKIARHCKECRNFNSMFAIISGLGHAAVSRLRLTWEKLPGKYQRLFSDLQDLMDPSRNMSKYRQLVSSELLAQHPIIPFYPIVKKDLTFIHLGNDTRVDQLINFEKLRMIAKEVRLLTHMCSSPYDLLAILELKGQSPSNAMFALNQMSASQNTSGSHTTTIIAANAGQSTIKRRKKSTAAPNPKKMFEEAQMVRRVKAYLNNLKIISDEDLLHKFSLECEPSQNSSSACSQSHNSTSGGGGGGSGIGNASLRSGDQLSIYSQTSSSSAPNSSLSLRKRHPSSPTLSTTSSTSSTSDHQRRQLNSNCPKFGTASPQAVKKILALSESTKIRPHQPYGPRHSALGMPTLPLLNTPHHMLNFTNTATNIVNPSPCAHRRLGSSSNSMPNNVLPARAIHERSHSDTATPPLPSVDLSVESSSVTTFRDLPLRKSVTSGSVSSSDSGHGSYAQTHEVSPIAATTIMPPPPPPPPPSLAAVTNQGTSVYTAADCRLLQQISNTAARQYNNNTPPPPPPPLPTHQHKHNLQQQQQQQHQYSHQHAHKANNNYVQVHQMSRSTPPPIPQHTSTQMTLPPPPPPLTTHQHMQLQHQLHQQHQQQHQQQLYVIRNANKHLYQSAAVPASVTNTSSAAAYGPMIHQTLVANNNRHAAMHGARNYLESGSCPVCPMPPMNP